MAKTAVNGWYRPEAGHPMNPRLYSLMADAVLILHFAFVAFVVIGLVVILLGGLCRWKFVRNFFFRAAHVAAIGFVVAEAVAGITCPLTAWENDLRLLAGGGGSYAGSFVQHWIHRIMFFEASEFTFTVIYVVFFVIVLLSFGLVRPRWPGWLSGSSQKVQTRT